MLLWKLDGKSQQVQLEARENDGVTCSQFDTCQIVFNTIFQEIVKRFAYTSWHLVKHWQLSIWYFKFYAVFTKFINNISFMILHFILFNEKLDGIRQNFWTCQNFDSYHKENKFRLKLNTIRGDKLIISSTNFAYFK